MSEPEVGREVDVLAEEYWQHYLDVHPTEGHLVGDYSRAGAFESATREAEDLDLAALRGFARRAEALDETALDPQRRITRAVLIDDATSRADLTDQRLQELAADPVFGPHIDLPLIMELLSFPDAEVATALADKLRGVGRFFHELAERQREGVASGRLPAAFAVAGTVAQIDEILATPVADDRLLAADPPATGLDVEAWRDRLRAVVESDVRPGLAAYRDVLRDEVLPRARPDDRCGLGWLSDGETAYAAALRFYTTTTRTAQEIHDIGLAQVEKLAEEYRELGPEVVGTDDLPKIFEALRTDPALHFSSGDELVRASEVALQRAWDVMPGWFKVVPRARCAVQASTSGAIAFYFPPASDGSRGGTFFVNVADPSAWGTFELESTAFHEGIPGHHLQLAIASELTDVPEFRRHIANDAYAEGWGLYSERLSDEMGLYTGAVDRMGMFASDSLRATRLVVDTGLHALGWSRQRAIDYMVANSPLSEAMVRPEVDRYIVSPGQATSYMIGRLEIQRMRAEAEQRQADGFDIKAFHSAVLDSGALPLGVLDDVVRTRLA